MNPGISAENVFEMIGPHTVVYANEGRRVIVVYNHSATFNVYATDEKGSFLNVDVWMTDAERAKQMTAKELWEYCDQHFLKQDAENKEEDEDGDDK